MQLLEDHSTWVSLTNFLRKKKAPGIPIGTVLRLRSAGHEDEQVLLGGISHCNVGGVAWPWKSKRVVAAFRVTNGECWHHFAELPGNDTTITTPEQLYELSSYGRLYMPDGTPAEEMLVPQPGPRLNFKAGTKILGYESGIWVLSMVDANKWCFINVKAGIRWTNPMTVPGGDPIDETVLRTLLPMVDLSAAFVCWPEGMGPC